MTAATGSGQGPEFSRVLMLEELSAGVVERTLDAAVTERIALAQRFGLIELGSLRADLTIRRTVVGDVVLHGALHAEVTQECTVTLEPVPATVDETFHLRFGRHDGEVDDAVDELLPETELDLGEIVAQQLSLSLDPYPRAPGATLPPAEETPPGADQPGGPFAALAGLRKGDR